MPPTPAPPGPPEQSPLIRAITLYRAGKLTEAEAILRRLVQRKDAPADAALILAQVLMDQQKSEQAAFELQKLIRSRPGDAKPWLLLGKVWMGRGDYTRSLGILDEAAATVPESAEILISRGIVCVQLGRLVEAEQSLRRAWELNPDHVLAVMWLGQVLSGSLRVRDAVELLRADMRANPGRTGVQQNLAFLLHYLDDVGPDEMLREHRLAGLLAARSADQVPPRVVVEPDPERKLTVGYLSPDFRQHSCAYFIEPLLASHDRSRFRIIAYSSTTAKDGVTTRLRALTDEWRDTRTMDDAALAAMIAKDRVDIAVDLAGHSSGNRLPALAYRPAPIAMTYLGYPNTTGMQAIDYRIVDACTDPPGAEAQSTETLIRVDGCFLCYRPPEDAPGVAPPPCAAGDRGVTFGSFNALDKVSAATAAAWAGVLAAVPGSRLLLKGSKLADPVVRDRLMGLFKSKGLDPSRIECLIWTSGIREHLECYGRMDIALDPFPYNGTTTTCEALWMGVPVVALAGGMHAGRVGVSLLTAVGQPGLVAGSADEYVRIAAALAADRPRLTTLRTELRAAMAASPLCDGPGHARRIEARYREAWRRWCAARERQG